MDTEKYRIILHHKIGRVKHYHYCTTIEETIQYVNQIASILTFLNHYDLIFEGALITLEYREDENGQYLDWYDESGHDISDYIDTEQTYLGLKYYEIQSRLMLKQEPCII